MAGSDGPEGGAGYLRESLFSNPPLGGCGRLGRKLDGNLGGVYGIGTVRNTYLTNGRHVPVILPTSSGRGGSSARIAVMRLE